MEAERDIKQRPIGGKRKMNLSLLIMAGLVMVLAMLALRFHGMEGLTSGMQQSFNLLKSVAFQILLGFTAAGLIQIVVPPQLISKLVGEGSGIPGVLVGTVAGALTPAGPFVSFPIVLALYKSGAAVGPLVAYIIAWGIIPLHRFFIWELPLMGPGFAFPRYLVSVALPVAAGIAAPYVFAAFHRILPNIK